MAETILYYDCFAGISGDMNLAAMLDMGVPEAHLRTELAKLPLTGYSLRVSRDARKGITGTRVDVEVQEAPHGHDHSSWRDIRRIIDGSTLPDPVKARACDIFRRLAEAEARVHGSTVDDVHFHEVGAVDSIVDIVGAAICLEYLKPDAVMASSVELGGGFVRSQHGMLPVPAPATALLLSGVPTRSGVVPFEMTTPTGAAIIAHSVGSFSDDKRFITRKVAHGIGHRDTEVPNVLRLFLAEAPDTPTEEARLIECNIDDMSPEVSGHIMDVLLDAGASDVFFIPIVMKKSRPAVMLSVLCPSAMEASIIDIVLRETTTFGLRITTVSKTVLDREERFVTTSLGGVRVKIGKMNGRKLKAKPEFEDCRRIARDSGMSLREVLEIVQREAGGLA
jgi:pyridinium-3,5-bisthiocarboxylic acid mononucleotide nickel chelatase